MRMFEETGIDHIGRRIVCNVYWYQEATLKVEEYQTENQKLRRGVRQGCVILPHLFNLYSGIISVGLQGRKGTSLEGVNNDNVRYPDDTVLVVDSAEKL